MPHVFQPGKSAGLNATFHFTFTGNEQRQATVVIKDQKMSVEEGHVGQPDLHVTADSQTWIGFLRKEKTWCGHSCGGRFGSMAHSSCWWRSESKPSALIFTSNCKEKKQCWQPS